MDDLSAAGLNTTEAKTYKALLSKPDWLPSELAQTVSETRTNMYKILDNLVGLQLADKITTAKKLRYRARHPARLMELAHELRTKQEQAEKALELQSQSLLAEYVKVHEQPGVRYFQGKAEIGKMFREIAESSEEVVFVHTLAGIDFYGFTDMHNLRMLAPLAGTKRRTLTPDGADAPTDYETSDPKVLLERTWLQAKDYTAPVEWGAFDDKLYIISYGNEAMGLIIENKQIAEAFKQLFDLLERGQKLLPKYTDLPELAKAKSADAKILPVRK